jgi:hypothetical protein
MFYDSEKSKLFMISIERTDEENEAGQGRKIKRLAGGD